MGKKSLNINDNVYCDRRQKAGMTRAQASEATYISESRIEKIESGKIEPNPEDVYAMSQAYKDPGLCNYYCSQVCRIGREYVPEVKAKTLSEIVIEMLASLNSLNREKDRLIEIVADGRIADDELRDFASIKNQLEQLSLTVDALQLWVNRTIASGAIDKDKLEELCEELKK
ncbi:MAG: helix-turn-helix domain-containing protein [Emergencia sp.]